MPSDYQIAITRPCRDAPGRFTAESSYGRRLDMAAICVIVKSYPEAKCSESLGVAKFEFGDNSIILYRSGRIDLRRVRDVTHARAVMTEVEQVIRGAFEPEDNVHQNVKA
jgi:ArsR family metal-binding transcriptional regulator